MTDHFARTLMTIAAAAMGDHRRDWSAAMAAEFDDAAADGHALPFAVGCLVAAWRELLTSARGHFALTTYALALGVMLPMAALQIGCALLGFPYLYPGRQGLPGALLEGGSHELLIRGVYQAAIPSIALIQLVIGIGHLRLAWALLDRDWPRVRRLATQILAAAATLVLFMGVLFLDSRQALLHGALLAVELVILTIVVRWWAELFPAARPAPPT